MNVFSAAEALIREWFSVSKDKETPSLKDEDAFEVFNSISKERIQADVLDMEHIDENDAWEKIAARITSSEDKPFKKVALSQHRWWRYAAIILISLSVGAIIKYQWSDASQRNFQLLLNTDLATLRINEKIIEIPQQNIFEFKDDATGDILAIKKNNRLTYSSKSKTTSIHHLKVPNGNRMTLLLSDGTKVICDAGSAITYPSVFKSGSPREVTLEGQAYFDITEGTDAFLVHTKNTTAEVTGTQFNITAYPEENNTDIILVEGVVKVNAKKGTTTTKTGDLLLPGQRMLYNGALNKIHISSVNTYDHTAWVSGKLVFQGTPFKNIIETLERKYNVTIENRKPEIENKMFKAKFDNENLEDILNAFKANSSFSYAIENNAIVIR